MFIEYQVLLYSENRIVDSLKFYGYDDFSAIAKTKRLFSSGHFDVVSLTRNGKNVKRFK